MNVNVRGKNIDVTPALKDYVEKKITKVTKQFKTVGDISAVLKVEKGIILWKLLYRQWDLAESTGNDQRYVFLH